MPPAILIAISLFIFWLLMTLFGKPTKDTSGQKSKVRSKSKSAKNPKATIFFHEDDYCQIELIPRENGGSLELEKAMIRNGEQIKLIERGIKRQEFEQIVGQLATTKHEAISTGYGESYRILSENTNAYGKDYSAIYYKWTHDEIIEKIWLTNPFNLQESGIVDTLQKIGRIWNLILVDWKSEEVVNLYEDVEIRKYLL